MRNLSKRQVFSSAVAAGSLSLRGLLKANSLEMPLGFQIYGVREQASKDVAGALKQVATPGYKRVRLCSFPGYVTAGFGQLLIACRKPDGVRKTVEDNTYLQN